MTDQNNQKKITVEEASQIFYDANELKAAEKDLSKTYLRRDTKNDCINKLATILNDTKSAQQKLEYDTKMDIAAFRLEKLKIKEDMLLMKLNYYQDVYANDVAKKS